MGLHDLARSLSRHEGKPTKEKLALQEYIVGGSALPKSLIEGFEKILG
jgi:hypothetical protein